MSYAKVWESTNVEYRAEALDRLRELFPAGSEVITLIRHVTSSGMGRVITVLAITLTEDENFTRIVNVSNDVARVLGWKYDRDRNGVYVTGCGMDMAFHTIYSLSRTLHADHVFTAEESRRYGTDAGYLITTRTL